MPGRIDFDKVPETTGASYPPPFDEKVRTRRRRALGDAAGLTQFGVNLLTIPPGIWSSQRHWHSHEDEFFYVLEGEVVFVTDTGEEVLGPGQAAGAKCGEGIGHHFQNRSDADAVLLVVGTRDGRDVCRYPELDLVAGTENGVAWFTRRDGTPYPRA